MWKVFKGFLGAGLALLVLFIVAMAVIPAVQDAGPGGAIVELLDSLFGPTTQYLAAPDATGQSSRFFDIFIVVGALLLLIWVVSHASKKAAHNFREAIHGPPKEKKKKDKH